MGTYGLLGNGCSACLEAKEFSEVKRKGRMLPSCGALLSHAQESGPSQEVLIMPQDYTKCSIFL